jgi:outer membrane receptor protein involved in Fe transport
VLPPTATTFDVVDGRPSPFEDPEAALGFFRNALPGEVGIRNLLRGDGFFSVDLGLSKSIAIGDRARIRLRADVYNVTNTPSFDVNQVTMFPDRSGFGRYDGTLPTCDALAGRCMQFAARVEF